MTVLLYIPDFNSRLQYILYCKPLLTIPDLTELVVRTRSGKRVPIGGDQFVERNSVPDPFQGRIRTHHSKSRDGRCLNESIPLVYEGALGLPWSGVTMISVSDEGCRDQKGTRDMNTRSTPEIPYVTGEGTRYSYTLYS